MDTINVFELADQETQALLRGCISGSSGGTYELKLIFFHDVVVQQPEQFWGVCQFDFIGENGGGRCHRQGSAHFGREAQ